MILEIKEVLDNTARQNGHANWQVATYRLNQEALHDLYLKAFDTVNSRAFAAGWSERASSVGCDKKALQKRWEREIKMATQKLNINQ